MNQEFESDGLVDLIFALDLIESSLRIIGDRKSTAKVKPVKLLNELRTLNKGRYSAVKVKEIKIALRRVFPIYRNRRRRVKKFKLSYWAIRWFLLTKGLSMASCEQLNIPRTRDWKIRKTKRRYPS